MCDVFTSERGKSCELPGGKRYQIDGERLENAFFKNIPKSIKSNMSVNIKPMDTRGNISVELDMLYHSKETKRVISFEIKGVNKNTINSVERQHKLIKQGIRQKMFLFDHYSDYTIDVVYCFVIGRKTDDTKIDDSEWKTVTKSTNPLNFNPQFIKQLKENGFKVAIGETPRQCAKKAFLLLNLIK
jgi:hypothetical protein